jgi:hypothetical protein
MGHLLSVRRRTPYLSELTTAASLREATAMLRAAFAPRWQILAAWCGAVVVAAIFNEVPALQVPCGTASVPADFWLIALAWSAAIFLVAEARKWAIFLWPQGLLARLAW